MRAYRLLILLMIIANALIVQAHVCSDVLSGGSQYNPGCDPVIITVNGATQNGNTVTVPMTFENRQTPFSPASSCGNPWSGGLGSVRISRMTESPSCSGCFTRNNPGTKTVNINSQASFNNVVTISGSAAPGTYSLTFYFSSDQFTENRNVVVSDIVVSSSCTDTCSSLGYNCGSQTICGSTQNCGSCSATTCSASHTTGSCTPTCNSGVCGSCTPTCTCQSGYYNCDGNMANGCESSTSCCTDTCSSLGYNCGSQTICGSTQNCGSCSATTCSASHTAGSCTPACSSGHCGTCTPTCTCSSGWYNCDSNMANGCESSSTCCSNACTAGTHQCSGTSLQTCGDYNADGCTEWGATTACTDNVCKTPACSGGACGETNIGAGLTDTGCTGSTGCTGGSCKCDGTGQCTSQPSCSSQCTPSGSRQCSGISYQTCSDTNADGCLEWGTLTACADNVCHTPTCTGGVCGETHVTAGTTDTGCAASTGCTGGSCKCDGNGVCTSQPGPCTDTCASLGFNCGTQTVCSVSQSCGTCQASSCTAAHTTGSCTPTCTSGMCGSCTPTCTCSSGWYNCDGSMANGCESSVACCSDQCTPSGSRQCLGTSYQTCSDINADSCLEWGSTVACPNNRCKLPSCAGGVCSETNMPANTTDEACYGSTGCSGTNCRCDGSGSCTSYPSTIQSAANCTSTCGTVDQVSCLGDVVAVCGDYNHDTCMEWANVTNCKVKGGLCCSGTCKDPACARDSDCDDSKACTKDRCLKNSTCMAVCSNIPVTSCLSGDGCCPSGCTASTDTDCICAPQWTCSEYLPKDCPQSGKRTRTCTDSSGCGTSAGRPTEEQACQYSGSTSGTGGSQAGQGGTGGENQANASAAGGPGQAPAIIGTLKSASPYAAAGIAVILILAVGITVALRASKSSQPSEPAVSATQQLHSEFENTARQYVTGLIAKGYSKEDIKALLQKANYSEELIGRLLS